jgi:hypothetical protein
MKVVTYAQLGLSDARRESEMTDFENSSGFFLQNLWHGTTY